MIRPQSNSTRPTKTALAICSLLLLVCVTVQAETWLGRFGSLGEPDIIRIYADGASGNLAPLGQVGGANTGLVSASGMFFDALADEVYVTDFSGQRIVILSASARGDATPIRAFTSALGVAQARRAIRIGASNEIAVLRNSGIYIFPRSVNGEVAPIRSIQGAATTFSTGNPNSIAHLPQSQEFVVADGKPSGNDFVGDVLFFADSASGNVAPSRRRSGAALGRFVWDVLWLPSRPDELFLLVEGPAVGGQSPLSVVVIPVAGDGPVTALRTIGGSNTQMVNGGAIAYNPTTQEIIVSTGLWGVTPRVVSFPVAGNGNLTPSRNLTGANVGGPFSGIASVRSDRIFANGFQF